jgi:hypothetical protein
MKNGDLLILDSHNTWETQSLVYTGRADGLDISIFTEPADMTCWEMACYVAYDAVHGLKACELAGINFLDDMFGGEFNDKFFTHKKILIAKKYLQNALAERKNANKYIRQLRAFLRDPTPNFPWENQ